MKRVLLVVFVFAVCGCAGRTIKMEKPADLSKEYARIYMIRYENDIMALSTESLSTGDKWSLAGQILVGAPHGATPFRFHLLEKKQRTLVPLLKSDTGYPSRFYFDVPEGPIELILATTNGMLFHKMESNLGSIGLTLEPGQAYQLVMGHKGLSKKDGWYEWGIMDITLPSEDQQYCMNLRSQPITAKELSKKLMERFKIRGGRFACEAIVTGLPLPEIDDRFKKWVDKKTDTIFERLKTKKLEE